MTNERKRLRPFKRPTVMMLYIELVPLTLIRAGWGLIELILSPINSSNHRLHFEHFWLNAI